MGKRLPYTPNSRIRQALRLLWMRSRERAEALKNTGYCCSVCGAKQSAAKGREVKLEVHHLDGVDWTGLADEIRRRLLVDPKRLAPLCKGCHGEMHGEEGGEG
jgi:predicted HNH restriction endonuclease